MPIIKCKKCGSLASEYTEDLSQIICSSCKTVLANIELTEDAEKA